MLLIWTLSSSLAATWTVNADGSGSATSLAAAVARASDGDIIVLGEGDFSASVDLGSKALSIQGRGADRTRLLLETSGGTILSGSGDWSISELSLVAGGGRALYHQAGTLTASSVKISESGASTVRGAALYLASGSALLSELSVEGGSAEYGMIYAGWGSRLEMSGGGISQSSASLGAGIFAYGASLSLDGATFDRLASDGAGGAIWAQESSLGLVDATFYGNLSGSGNGGAIYAYLSTVALEGGSFELNANADYLSAYTGGGAIYASDSTFSARETVFEGNYSYYGGALYLYRTETDLDAVQLLDNWSYSAGAVYFIGPGALSDRDGAYEGNWSYYGAGAIILSSYTSAAFQGSRFLENAAYYANGGAVYIYYLSNTSWRDVRFEDNYAYYGGGALHLQSTYGEHELRSVSFSGNEAIYDRGAAIYGYYYAKLDLVDCRFDRNEGVQDGGALALLYSGATVRGSSFTDNRTTGGQGGAIYSYSGASYGSPLVLEDNDFTGNEADWHGGAVASTSDHVRFADNRFHSNSSGAGGLGGAVVLMAPLSHELNRNRFSANTAHYGAGVYVYGPLSAPGNWTNNQFIENTASIGGAAVLGDAGSTAILNNTFVGNSGVEEAADLAVYESALDVRNNLFAHEVSGAALHVYDDGSALGSSYTHNAFFAGAGGPVGGQLAATRLGEGTLLDLDPLLSRYVAGSSVDRQILVPLRDSPLLDAGDPALLDPDGSRADIGAWGGPGIVVEDGDGDGWPNWVDCDDGEPSAHPEGTDLWYDGVNGDCLSGSDYDQDGDGVDALPWGTDCDDLDAAVQSGCEDETTDTGDGGATDGGNPDGGAPADPAEPKGGCGCAGSPARPAIAPLLLLGLLVSRRRSRP